MTKEEVIEMLCKIASHVGDRVYWHELAHDCFCPNENKSALFGFQFHPEILAFIANAVNEKIQREYVDTTAWTED